MTGNILITGSNGFLGRTILFQLQAAGLSTLATDLAADSVISGVSYRKADITKIEEIKPLVDNITTVIHVAGWRTFLIPTRIQVKIFIELMKSVQKTWLLLPQRRVFGILF